MRFLVTVSMAISGLVLSVGLALAQTVDSGSTGADGVFNPTANGTLAVAPSGVFNFTTVNIPAGVTVRFTHNAANTPVTVLATGNVTIAGTLDVSGAPGRNGTLTTSLARSAGSGGPGGFDGGDGVNGLVSTTGGAGLGPGGSGGGTGNNAGGGSAGFLVAGVNGPNGFGTGGGGGVPYATNTLLPLIGGSGGGGAGAPFGNTGAGGGGGGGALLIASSGTITVTGTILAQGGSGGLDPGQFPGPGRGGGGSGGAVRLVATTLAGSGGTINVNGGTASGINGSPGRIRIEAFTNTAAFLFAGVPPTAISVANPTTVMLANAPTLRIASVAGVPTPATPSGSFATPDVTLPATTTNPVAVSLEGTNIPPGTSVTLRVQGEFGSVTLANTTLTGTQTATITSANVILPADQPSVLTASASFPLIAAAGDGPVFVQGEAVERIHVSASYGGGTRVAYITTSGREIVAQATR
jgi:hypothetical protein